MTEDKQIDLAAAARLSDITLRWTMTQVFFLIHSGLFSLVLIQFKAGTVLHVGVAVFGWLLCLLWLEATRRANRQIHYWNERLARFETREKPAVNVFATPEGEISSRAGVPIHKVLIWLIGAFLTAWTWLLGYSLSALRW